MDKIKVDSKRLCDFFEELSAQSLALKNSFVSMTDILNGCEEFLVCSSTGDILAKNREYREEGLEALEILQKEIASLLTIASEYEKSEKENVESAQRIDGG